MDADRVGKAAILAYRAAPPMPAGAWQTRCVGMRRVPTRFGDFSYSAVKTSMRQPTTDGAQTIYHSGLPAIRLANGNRG